MISEEKKTDARTLAVVTKYSVRAHSQSTSLGCPVKVALRFPRSSITYAVDVQLSGQGQRGQLQHIPGDTEAEAAKPTTNGWGYGEGF